MSPAKKTAKSKNAKKSSKPAKPAKIAKTTRASKISKSTDGRNKASAKKSTVAAKTAKPVVSRSRPAPAVSSERSSEANETVRMVRELAAIVERRSLTELIIDNKQLTLTIRRGDAPITHTPSSTTIVQTGPAHMAAPASPAYAESAAVAAVASVPAVSPAEAVVDDSHKVTSPFVGTFYRRPNPDAALYADVGDKVTKGQTLCIVEAMKLMNEIEADVSGTITAVLVNDAEPVEYGQALFTIDPA